MIQLKDINKTYNNGAPLHVLKGINLDIQKGEFVSIMGSSGSGKSTLLNILGILDSYDTGEYYLNGTLIKNLSETKAAEYRNRMIGFIFQSFNLISFKNAVENVALPLFYQGVSRRKRNALALEYLDRLGLKAREFFVVSAHREENIDSDKNFTNLVATLNAIAEKYQMPVIVSTHPRTQKRVDAMGAKFHPLVRLLKPLGNPPPNGIKFFTTSDLLELCKDRAWLIKMTQAINQYWRHQNAKKKCQALTDGLPVSAAA